MKIVNRDITGYRGPKFTVLGRGSTPTRWVCICDCGKQFECSIYPILAGTRKSCGMSCGSKTHGYVGTKVYRAYQGMIRRCTAPGEESYPHYGGRGITVCERWVNSFLAFLEDMGEPEPHLTLERKDVNGNYTPENCIWATLKEQNRNQRNRANLTVNGVTKPVWQWAEETNQIASTIYSRIRRGWVGCEALWGRLEPRPKKAPSSKPRYRKLILELLGDKEWHSWMNVAAETGINREDTRKELLYLTTEGIVEVKRAKVSPDHWIKGKHWRLK